MWLKNTVNNCAILRSVLLSISRRFQQFRQSLLLGFRRVSIGSYIAPAHDVFYVRTDEIVWLTDFCQDDSVEARNRNFPMDRYRGSVIGGEWDCYKYRFDQLAVTRAITDRVSRDLPWRETEFFEECMRDIRTGRVLWGCRNEEQLEARLNFIDSIIDDMRTNGYKPGSESCLPGEDSGMLSKHSKYSDEITINIGRDGGYLFQDGRHRLSIAKALGVEMVPVKIFVRHELWCRKLKERRGLEAVCSAHPDLKYMFSGTEK